MTLNHLDDGIMPDFIFERACQRIADEIGVEAFHGYDSTKRAAVLFGEMHRLNAEFANSAPPELPDEEPWANPLFGSPLGRTSRSVA